MQAIRVTEKTGKDGTLSIRIPLGLPDAEYDVLVVVQPTTMECTSGAQGWPQDYFQKTFGSIGDETFKRQPQGEMPRSVELD